MKNSCALMAKTFTLCAWTLLLALPLGAAEPKAGGADAKAPAAKTEKKGAADKEQAPPTGPKGVFGRYQLSARMFKHTRDYFSKAVGGKLLLKFYSRYQHCCPPRRAGNYSPRDFLEYEIEKQVALLAVPKNYDGKPGWGILLQIMDNNAAVKDASSLVTPELLALLEKRKLIYLMPLGFSTSQPDVRRMGVCLDALATVMQEYQVDKGQVILSGVGGGAAIATVLLLDFPKLFCGMISQGHAHMLSRLEKRATYNVYNLPQGTTREFWEPEAPWMNAGRHKKVLRRAPRLAFYNNFGRGVDAERIYCGIYTWAKYGYDLVVLDLGRRTPMPLPWLAKIVEWIRTGKEVRGLPLPDYTRYKLKMPARKKKR